MDGGWVGQRDGAGWLQSWDRALMSPRPGDGLKFCLAVARLCLALESALPGDHLGQDRPREMTMSSRCLWISCQTVVGAAFA